MMKFRWMPLIPVIILSLIAAFVPVDRTENKKEAKVLISTNYQITVTDEHGTVLTDYTEPSDSYVIAFLDLLSVMINQTNRNIVDTSGNSQSIGTNSVNFRASAAGGDSSYGIVVGTGTNTVTLTDYNLQTLIANGSGSGQLNYSIVTLTSPTTTGSTRSFTISRSFQNSYTSSTTINELGLNVYGYSNHPLMILRDLIPGGQAVDPNNTVTVAYTISITV
jgi:hypothetical protein